MTLPVYFLTGQVKHEYFIVEFVTDGTVHGRGFYATFTIEDGELDEPAPIATVPGAGVCVKNMM